MGDFVQAVNPLNHVLDYQDYTAHGFLLQVEVCSKKI